MEETRQRLSSSTDLIITMIRGICNLEGETSDFEVFVNANEVRTRSFKNEGSRLYPNTIGLLIYGKNLSNSKFLADCLKQLRTPLKQKRPLRSKDSITQKEKDSL